MENLLYFLGGILATIVFGFIFYKLALRGGHPVYLQKSMRLLSAEDSVLPSEINIFFNDKQIKRLIKTNVMLWNNGIKTIDGKQIVSNLRIVLEYDANILSAKVLKVTKSANRFTINSAIGNEVTFSFEYLDSNDGVLLEIMHQSDNANFFIDGDIKGVAKGIRPYKNMFVKTTRNIVVFILSLFLIIGAVINEFAWVHLLIYAICGPLLVIFFFFDKFRPYPKELRDNNIEINIFA